jgi:RNA polymerase subunit RPABC4/transcription elongation factor Spt4
MVASTFGNVHDFFHSGTWLIIRNLSLFVIVVLWLASAFWVYKDAKRRVDDPWLVGIATLVGLVPILGPVIYMLMRPPEYLADVHERELEIRSMEHELGRLSACPACGGLVGADFLVCPSCATRLRQACPACQKPLEPAWHVCPFCATPTDSNVVTLDHTRRPPVSD